MKRYVLISILIVALALSGCAPAASTQAAVSPAAPVSGTPTQAGAPVAPTTAGFSMTSPNFKDGQALPNDYSCNGENKSPALNWSEPPAKTQTFVLLMQEPNSPKGVWFHWVVYNIPGTVRGLQEALPTEPHLADGTLQGKNSNDQTGYKGPCPTDTGSHTFVFTLYALDTALILSPNMGSTRVTKTMEGHILGQTQMTATYTKP